jgi:hypothetical protein
LLAAIACAWGLSWLLDFSLSKLLNISVADLQALLTLFCHSTQRKSGNKGY